MMAAMIIGLGISIVGTVMQVDAANKAAAAQERALNAQMKAEHAREQAMRLDAQRKKREQVRQGILARSQALATGTNQGAQFGSALPGVYGQIGGQQAFNMAGISGQEALGAEVFAANREVFAARKDEARAGAQSALGSGISSLGGAFGKSLGGIGRLGG